MFIGFDSWARATTHTLGGGSSGSSFGPVLAEPPLDLFGVEPLAGIDAQFRSRVIRGHAVPRNLRGGSS